MIIYYPVLVRIKNVSGRLVERIKTHFVLNNFFPKNLSVYGMMLKNTVQLDRPKIGI